ncbi:MAG: DUF1616 domain-containing protein [Dehalococcoidales bacterium]|nr:DUF1616 domain-containing protein [Dehalococcoidales bacterium]
MDVIGPIKELFNWAVPVLDNVPIIRAVIGIILVFFAPGFAWTLVLFKGINRIERLVLSFALSLALVTLSILGLNTVVNMRITGLNAFLSILLLTIIPLVIYFTRRYIHKRKTGQIEEK